MVVVASPMFEAKLADTAIHITDSRASQFWEGIAAVLTLCSVSLLLGILVGLHHLQ